MSESGSRSHVQGAARAMRRHARRMVEANERPLRYATVTGTAPLAATIVDSGLPVFDGDDLLTGQWARTYSQQVGFKAGDTLVLQETYDHDFLVVDVLSDSTPDLGAAAAGTGGTGGSPSGVAGGDLGGTYPNPTVIKSQAGFTVGGTGVVLTNDARLADSRTPSGVAGGSLAGTYPNPTIAAGAVGGTEVATAIKDPVAATAGLRTLGSGAQQAVAGNDARLADQRVPTDGSVTNAKVATTAAIAYSKLNLALAIVNGDIATAAAIAYSKLNLTSSIVHGDIAAANKDGVAATPSMRTLGTGAQQAAAGNDSRIVNAADKTLVDAKGDLLIGSAADTLARMAATGTAGNVLTEDPTTATGWKSAAPPGGTSYVIRTARVAITNLAASATTTVTVTWPTAFADTNYTWTWSIRTTTSGANDLRVLTALDKTASAVTVIVQNTTAGGAESGVLECIAIHD